MAAAVPAPDRAPTVQTLPQQIQSDPVQTGQGQPAKAVWVWYRWGVLLLLAVVISVVITWPLGTRLNSAVLLGAQPAATVPLLNVWTVWWNADSLSRGLQDYWNSPIFTPTPGTFAFSECQPTSMAVAPIVWWGSPVLAGNIYLLVSLVLNAAIGAWLLRRLGFQDGLAALGGVLFLLLPFVQAQLGVLQLIPIWGVLWTLGALHVLACQPSRWAGFMLGLAFGVTYLMCHYYGLFLSVLLVVCGPVLIGSGWKRRLTWEAIAISIVVAMAIVAPVVWAQRSYLLAQRFVREPVFADRLSTAWQDFLVPQGYAWLSHFLPVDRLAARWEFGPGLLKTVLAGGAVIGGLLTLSRRRVTLFWALLLTSSVLLASAPHVGAGDWTLQRLLVSTWPGFAQVRTPYRYAMFVQIAVVVLAVEALRLAINWLQTRHSPRVVTGVAVALGALLVVDVLPWSPGIANVPSTESSTHWAHWLRSHSDRADVVTCFPQVTGTSEAALEVSSRAMYFQTVHRCHLIEGYSGFFPQTYRDLRAVLRHFPDAESIARLSMHGVRYVVIDAGRFPPERLAQLSRWPERFQLRYVDRERQTYIYELLIQPLPAAGDPT